MTSLAVSSKSFIPEDIVESGLEKGLSEIALPEPPLDLADEGKSCWSVALFTNHVTRFTSSQNRFC